MLHVLRLSLAQLGDRKFRRVLLLGILSAALVFMLLLVGLLLLVPLIPDVGTTWLDQGIDILAGLGAVLMTMVVGYVFFPAVATLVMGLFLEDIADAVEHRHYPHTAARTKPRLSQQLMLGLRFTLFSITINLLLLPLYLILLATGVGSLLTGLIFVAINASLMGREYFEMVAIRHMPGTDVRVLRQHARGPIYQTGVMIALLFLVPVLNLLAPVLGAAMMTHSFHRLRK